MSRLLFWNVQRLGAGTDNVVRNGLIEIARRYRSDFNIFCELTPQCPYPKAINYAHVRNKDDQLCFGFMGSDLSDQAGLAEEYVPVITDEFRDAHFKGGANFRAFSSRGVVRLKNFGGLDVLAFHAPGGNGLKAVSYVIASLNETYGRKPWLLVGDLNVEPKVLKESKISLQIADWIKPPDDITYRNKGSNGFWTGKEYDYAVANIAAPVTVTVTPDTRAMEKLSDHLPIIVEW
ncbi:hypothetical protein ACQV5M_16700 [Leptospira sp. SA-E8]|uniref:hypothetical protein n=1 Tax=Leptospira sp. SA-E8 TaxID=3422259 RepID=UPI003EB97330